MSEKPSPAAGRLPSLNQLAARINVNSSTANAATANRPRLAVGNLRTSSSSSLASTATTNDSLAVQPSSTRSASPDGEEDKEDTTVTEPTGGLTSEKLEQLNAATTTKKAPAGYKNIPSLDAIARRMHQLSIDGTHKPPEPELVEDPKTPGIKVKAPEHPLQYNWTLYHDTKAKFPNSGPPSAIELPTPIESTNPTEYEANLTTIGSFSTVEEFCRYMNWLKPPSKLDRNSNYHLFKAGIKPMWEDPANANGGRWVLTMKNNPALLDKCWSWVAMALVGEELEEGRDEVCGAVVSLRSKMDRIQVWIRGKEDVERINGIGRKLVKLLDVSEQDGIGLEFQYNTDDRPLPNKFLSINAVPVTGFRASFQNEGRGGQPAGHNRGGSIGSSPLSVAPVDGVPGPTSAGGVQGGAFGAFGVGLGAWRTKRN